MPTVIASTAASEEISAPPTDRVAGYQRWRDLLFIHWRVPAGDLQPYLPDGLTVQEYDGSGWIGLVPFSMQAVRPWWAPAVPGISWFLETNVRTYVRHSNGQTGVWFFSLHADSRIAVAVAKRFWHLNYIYARMSCRRDESVWLWQGQESARPDRNYRISCELPDDAVLQTAEPGTCEHFLLERYVLFSASRNGELNTGRVQHSPYTFTPVSKLSCRQTVTEIAGITIPVGRPADHVVYSPGVDVSVTPLRSL